MTCCELVNYKNPRVLSRKITICFWYMQIFVQKKRFSIKNTIFTCYY